MDTEEPPAQVKSLFRVMEELQEEKCPLGSVCVDLSCPMAHTVIVGGEEKLTPGRRSHNCRYFLNNQCKEGSRCNFRHVGVAQNIGGFIPPYSGVPCEEGALCSSRICPHEHPGLDSDGNEVPVAIKKRRNCKHYANSKCIY
jgi:hypothetical protein